MKGDAVVFWELASHDEKKSAEFFRRVFGWDVRNDRSAGFHRASPPGGRDCSQGIIFTLRKAKLPFLTLYIGVKEMDAKRRLIEENGGLVVMEPTATGGGERICLFNEPSGVTFAMIEEKAG